MSYVVVKFPERREVFIDDQSQGDNVNDGGTPRALFAGEGWHTFRLGGLSDYTPPAQTLNVPDATQIKPFPVVFERRTSPLSPPQTDVTPATVDQVATPRKGPGPGGERWRPYLRMVSDQPIEDEHDDRLDFKAYATALAGLIDNPETSTPLTLAINAPWGAGKSTLATMVRRRLESKPSAGGSGPHVTFSFNAWLHDDARNLGSAFAGEVARAAHRRRPLTRRVLRPLPWSLSTPDERRRQIIIIAVLGVVVGLSLSVWHPGGQSSALEMVASVAAESSTSLGPGGTLGAVSAFGAILSVLKYLASLGKAVSAFVKDPERAAVGGSLQRVRAQLGTLIRQATPRGSRFVIFVDDLERCRPPRAVDLLETVTQLLNHKDVVTVIVADIPAVAACADIKYKSLADRYNPADAIPGAPPASRSIYGRLYIQKFVQLQFDIPSHRSDRLRELVGSLAVESAMPPTNTLPRWWTLLARSGRRVADGVGDGLRQVRYAVASQLHRIGPVAVLGAALGAVLVGWNQVAYASLVVAEVVVSALRAILFLVQWPVNEPPGPWPRVTDLLALGLRSVLVAVLVVWLGWRVFHLVRTIREERMAAARRAIDDLLRAGQTDDDDLKAAVADVLPKDKIEALIEERRLLQLMNDSELLRDAYDEVFGYLPQLPRNAKRVLNRLRLLLFVAHARRVLGGTPELTARHIGKWVALQECWPELAQVLLRRPGGIARLEDSVDDDARFKTVLADLLPGSGADNALQDFCRAPQTRLKDVMERIVYFAAADDRAESPAALQRPPKCTTPGRRRKSRPKAARRR